MFAGDGTVADLDAFIEHINQTGVLKAATAVSYRTATRAVLKVVGDENFHRDVRDMDVEYVCDEFADAAKELNPVTVESYKSRFTASVDLYKQWLANPRSISMNYRNGAPPTSESRPIEIHIHIHV